MPIWVYVAALAVAGAAPLLWWSVAAETGGKLVREHLREVSVLRRDLREIDLAQSARTRLLEPGVEALARRARRFTPPGVLEALEHRIRLAGASASWPIERVLAAKVVAGVVAAFFSLLILAANPTFGGFVLAGGIGGTGWFGPDLLLLARARERQGAIGRSLPDVLDQVTISVEAGLGFEAALAQAGRSGRGPLAEELVRTLQDVQVGMHRATALANLIERTDVEDLRHFVLAVKQAENYGVPIAQVLRVQSKEMREKRRQRAEERAMKIPVKIVFPLVLCILPALFVVVIGPGAIRISETLFQ